MKHIYKIALTVVLSSCLLFTTGCSMLGISGNAFSKFESSHEGFFQNGHNTDSTLPDAIPSFYAGSWKITGVIVDGEKLTGWELEDFLDDNSYLASMLLKEDGTFLFSFDMSGTVSGTWEIRNGKEIALIATIDDRQDTEILEISEDGLIAELDSDTKAIFTKEAEGNSSYQVPNQIIGRCKPVGGEVDGTYYNQQEIIDESGLVFIQLSGDATFAVQTTDDTINGNWSCSGNQLELIADAYPDEPLTARVENSRMELYAQNGGVVYLELEIS